MEPHVRQTKRFISRICIHCSHLSTYGRSNFGNLWESIRNYTESKVRTHFISDGDSMEMDFSEQSWSMTISCANPWSSSSGDAFGRGLETLIMKLSIGYQQDIMKLYWEGLSGGYLTLEGTDISRISAKVSRLVHTLATGRWWGSTRETYLSIGRLTRLSERIEIRETMGNLQSAITNVRPDRVT